MKNIFRKRIIGMLVCFALMFSLLLGISLTTNVSAASKTYSAGTIYYPGDTITVSEMVYLQLYGTSSDWRGQCQPGTYTVNAATYNPSSHRWSMKAGGTMLFDSTNGNAIITGIKCISGTGTYSNPFRFELVYPEYPLSIAGTKVTGGNANNVFGDGKVSYVPASNGNPAVLTLNGYSCSKSGNIVNYTGSEDLKINITGTNVLTNTDGNQGAIVGTNANLIFSGTGSLTVNAPNGFGGIYNNKNITINSGTISATGKISAIRSESGAVVINGGTVNTSDSIVGIMAGGDITIAGGSVTATGTTYAILGSVLNISEGAELTAVGYSKAINCNVKNAITGTGWSDEDGTENKTKIEVSSTGQELGDYKKVQFPAVPDEYPIWIGNTQLTSANANNVFGDGKVSFTPADGDDPAVLTLNGASITTGYVIDYGFGDIESYGIYYTGSDDLKIVLTAGTTNTISGLTFAVFSKSESSTVIISGTGTLNAAATWRAIYSSASLAIESGTIVASATDENGTAIFVSDNIAINGGTITATAPYRGITCYEGNISITEDAILTATGSDSAIGGNVKNAIHGTGWSDVAGTQDKTYIGETDTATELSYKKVQFPAVLDSLSYLDASGTAQVCENYRFVTPNTKTFKHDTWYVVGDESVVNENRIKVEGTAHLILMDGTTFTAKNGINVPNDKSLTIYAQSTGDEVGILYSGTTNGNDYSGIHAGIGGDYDNDLYIYPCGVITINGGTIYANGGMYSSGIGGDNSTVTVNGGTVTATGNFAPGIGCPYGSLGGTFTFNGGVVTAIAIDEYSDAIGGYDANKGTGTIVLGDGMYLYGGEDANSLVNIEEEDDDYARCKYMVVNNVVPHTHSFTYSANGATITATCTADGCTLDDGTEQHNHTATLTLVSPTLTTYGQTGNVSADVTITDANEIKGEAVVYYYKATKNGNTYTKSGDVLPGAPTNAGDYIAEITLGEPTSSQATAVLGYTIAKADPTANAPTGLSATYGETLDDVTLSNPIGNTAGTWEWNDDTTSVGNAGVNTFKATFTPEDTDNYKTVAEVDVSVTVNKANPDYTVPTEITATYGDTLASVSLPEGWSWANEATNVGTVDTRTFKATFTPEDTDNYNVVSNIDVSVTIGKKELTVTAQDKNITYGDVAPDNEVEITGFVNNETVQDLTGDLSYECSYAEGDDAAEYEIVPSGYTSDNYEITYVNGTLSVAPKSVTVTAYDKDKTYGEDDPDLTYEVIGLVGEDTLDGELARAEGEDVSEYDITQGTLTNENNPNYDIVFNTGAKFTINRKAVTVTADEQSKTYGEDDPDLTYEAEGLVGEDTLTGALTRAEGKNVSEYDITQGTLTNENNPNYDITFNGAVLTINKKAITVTATDKTKSYGSEDPDFTYTATGVVSGDTLIGVLERTEGENVGAYEINQGTLTNDNNPNYDITFVSGKFLVNRKAIFVKARSNWKTYGDIDPKLTYEVTGLVGEDELEGKLKRVAGENVGEYNILAGTITNENNPNYHIIFVTNKLIIIKKKLTVIPNDAVKTYGESDPKFTYTIVGLSPKDTVTGSLGRMAGEDVGTYTITAGNLSAGSNYSVILQESAQLTINAKVITVKANDLVKTYGESDPALTYKAEGLVGEDKLAGALTRASGENVGTYTIEVGTLSSEGNYKINFVEGTLKVVAKSVTVKANDQKKVLNTSDPELTFTVEGLVGSDKLTGALTREAGESVGTYAITQGTLAASDNYAINFTGATFTICLSTVEISAKLGEGAPELKIEAVNEEEIKSLLTAEEKAALDNGEIVKMFVDVTKGSGDDKNIEKKLKMKVGMYLNLPMFKQVNDGNKVAVSDTNGKMFKITITIPEELKNTNAKVKRTFYVVSDETTVLAESAGDTISFETDKFSTIALAFKDESTSSLTWLWIVLAVVGVAGAGCAVYFVLKKKNSGKAESTEDDADKSDVSDDVE